MTKTFQHEILFGFSKFGHWYLFGIWNLIFDGFVKSLKSSLFVIPAKAGIH